MAIPSTLSSPGSRSRAAFDAAYGELVAARLAYENLRVGGGDFDQLSNARNRLMHTRARMAVARRGL